VAARERSAADAYAPPALRAVPTRPAPSAVPPVGAPGSSAPARPPAAPGVSPEVISRLRLQFLVYSEVPGERLVFINNRKYTEGQSVEGDVIVEKITPDGAVMTYQGQRFVLRAEAR